MIDVCARFKKYSNFTLVGPLVRESPETSNDFIIFVDGGAKAYSNKIKKPHLIIGDGDSAVHGCPEMQVHLNPEKDFSDLNFVLRQLPDHTQKLNLVGFLGGRLDHQLAVWGDCSRFLKTAKSLKGIEFDQGQHLMLNEGTHELEFNGLFSLLSLELVQIQITGNAKYTLEAKTQLAPFSSHCISNIGYGNVLIQTSGVLLVF